MSIGRTLPGDHLSHTHASPSTHACRELHVYACSIHSTHTYDTYREASTPPAQKCTDIHCSPYPSIVQQRYLLCVWMWPLAQGPSPSIYHQSFEAIKHFSIRIARSSLSKTERSDSQSHFLPNPIKGGEGREGENEVEDLKWRAFI